MFSPLICGAFQPDEEENDMSWSPSSTPGRSSRRRDNKNPYSMIGLDKFSALLADLEEKKQKIYSEKDSQDISFVRFVYSNSNDCVPIVVKVKDKKQQEDHIQTHKTDTNVVAENSQTSDKFPVQEIQQQQQPRLLESEDNKNSKKMRLLTWNFMKMKKWRRPSYYLPAAVILILFFLALFGRSVAILCTSIGWYMLPSLSAKKGTKSTNKKEYVRRLSGIQMGSDEKEKGARQHGHRKSW